MDNDKRRPQDGREKTGGFTLIELIVVMAVMMIAAIVIVALFINSSRQYHTQSNSVSLQVEAQSLESLLKNDIRSTETACSVSSGGRQLDLYSKSEDGTVVRNCYTYDASSKRIYYQQFEKNAGGWTASEDPQIFASEVSDIQYRIEDQSAGDVTFSGGTESDTAPVKIVFSAKFSLDSQSYQLDSEAAFRNQVKAYADPSAALSEL